MFIRIVHHHCSHLRDHWFLSLFVQVLLQIKISFGEFLGRRNLLDPNDFSSIARPAAIIGLDSAIRTWSRQTIGIGTYRLNTSQPASAHFLFFFDPFISASPILVTSSLILPILQRLDLGSTTLVDGLPVLPTWLISKCWPSPISWAATDEDFFLSFIVFIYKSSVGAVMHAVIQLPIHISIRPRITHSFTHSFIFYSFIHSFIISFIHPII